MSLNLGNLESITSLSARNVHLLDTFEYSSCLIHLVAFHPNGRYLITGHFDGSLYRYDITTSRLDEFQPKHIDTLVSLAISNDGKNVAAGASYGMVGMWDTETVTQEVMYLGDKGPKNYVSGVAFSPENLLATGDRYAKVRILNALAGQLLMEWNNYYITSNVIFSSNGKILAAGGNFLEPQGTSVAKAWIWDVESKSEKLSVDWGDNISFVAFNPSNELLVISSEVYDLSPSRTATLIWNIQANSKVLDSIDHDLSKAVFSPDGSLVAGLTLDLSVRKCTVKLLDPYSFNLLAELLPHPATKCFAFNHNGTMLVTCGGTLEQAIIQFWGIRY